MSYDRIPGYSGFLNIYDQAVEEAKDGDIFVEVGVALGHSIAYLARKVIDSGRAISVCAVDPWGGYARNGEQQQMLKDGKGDFRLFLDQMIAHAPEELETIHVIRATSVEAARMFHYLNPFMVMIDAAHDYESVYQDIDHWKAVVRTGGLIAGDDHEPNYPGVEKACKVHFGEDYEVMGTAWLKRL